MSDPLQPGHPLLDLRDPDPTRARSTIAAAARAVGADPDRVAGIVLASHEALVNAREHGRPPVRLRVWQRPGHLVVRVSDGGRGPGVDFAGERRPAGAQLPPHPASDPSVRGHGLRLMRWFSDGVATEHAQRGFTVELVCELPARPGTQAP